MNEEEVVFSRISIPLMKNRRYLSLSDQVATNQENLRRSFEELFSLKAKFEIHDWEKEGF